MSKLFLSENRFTPLDIKVTEASRFYGHMTKDIKIVLEAIEPSPDNVNVNVDVNPFDPYSSNNILGPNYNLYKANVLIGSKVAFSCTLLELNALSTAISNYVQSLNNQI